MFLQHIEISHFRNLTFATLSLPHHGLCVVSGPNGSGKTTLLEAIYTLTCGKSFRSVDSGQLIQNEHERFSLFATLLPHKVEPDHLQQVTVGVQRERNCNIIAKCMGEPEKFAEISRLLPLRTISPTEAYMLINGGPECRRRFLDWGVFHVKHTYWEVHKKLSRVIKQKCAALKMHCSEQELIQWNKILCELSYALHTMREAYVESLKKIFAQYQAILPAIQNVKLDYFPGWHSEVGDLLTQLSTIFKQERQQGHCLLGPHRAELLLTTSFGHSKDQLSRGRQKILAIALYLAQGELLFRERNQHPLYLIDDFSSELDSEGQKLLLDALNLEDKQVIITTLDAENTLLTEACRKNRDVARYTIAAGKIISST